MPMVRCLLLPLLGPVAACVSVAACVQSPRPVTGGTMERVLGAAAGRLADAGPRVKCERDGPAKLSCAEMFDEDHFTSVDVTVERRAAGTLTIPQVRADQPALGPAGGGGRYRRATADGAWLVTVMEFQRLARGNEPRMHSAVRVIDGILADYDRGAGRPGLGAGSP